MAQVNLPPGFELVEPSSTLPPGFELVAPPPKYDATGFTKAAPQKGQYASASDDPNQVGLLNGLGGALEGIDRASYAAGDWTSEKARQLGASPEVAGGIGAAVNMGAQALPTMGVGGAVAEGVGALTKPFAKSLMGSALKPTWEMWRHGKAERAINTMLNEPNAVMPGVNATEGGMDFMRSRSAELQALVKELIGGSSATVDKRVVTNYGQDAIEKFANQPHALRAEDDILNSMDNFYKHPRIAGKQDIPVQTAQELKQGYYKALGDKSYDELKTPVTEGEKAIARGLRTEIEKKVPEVVEPNRRVADLINAIKVGDRRVQMSSNNNLLSLAPLANGPSGVAAMLADKWGLGKSALARILYSAIPEASKGGISAAQWAESINRKDDK